VAVLTPFFSQRLFGETNHGGLPYEYHGYSHQVGTKIGISWHIGIHKAGCTKIHERFGRAIRDLPRLCRIFWSHQMIEAEPLRKILRGMTNPLVMTNNYQWGKSMDFHGISWDLMGFIRIYDI